MSEYPLDAEIIDRAVERALEQRRLVGAVVLVARGGEILYRRAAGMADREAGLPMRANALFRLASVSKPIVSTAALALMAQGRLGLDDPVTRWLPAFRPRTADGREPPMTVRHLMTHTAGLSYRFSNRNRAPTRRPGCRTAWMTIGSAWRRICSALPRRRCCRRREPSGVIR